MSKKKRRVLSKRINISITPKELHKVWLDFIEENRASFDSSLSRAIKFAMQKLMEEYGFNWKEKLAELQNPLIKLEISETEES